MSSSYLPTSHRRGKSFHDSPSATSPFRRRDKLELLISRAKTTNLAVLVLISVSALSLLLNLRWFLITSIYFETTNRIVPVSIRATLASPHSSLKHLVMVPGHAIWNGNDASKAANDEDWILEPSQTGGDVKTYLRHITAGAELAVRDPQALLIYSGGQTRLDPRTSLTEASSYARLARAGNIYSQFAQQTESGVTEFDRVTTEEFALDSFENVLFSISRFKEFTGSYPTIITVVGYGMKRRRYEEVHRAAVRWSPATFRYIGIDNEGETAQDYLGERIGGLEPFLKDFYGCKGALLAKRRKRNPYRRHHGYHSGAPELSALLEYCPEKNEMFRGSLPWDR